MHCSTTTHMFTIAKGSVSRKSTLKSTITISTIEVDNMTIKEIANEGIWLQGLLENFGIVLKQINEHWDSQSAIHLKKTKSIMHIQNTSMLSFTF